MKDYSKLRNESDIRGIAIEGVPGQEVNLTEQACRDIGRGFALWLIQRSGKTCLLYTSAAAVVVSKKR